MIWCCSSSCGLSTSLYLEGIRRNAKELKRIQCRGCSLTDAWTVGYKRVKKLYKVVRRMRTSFLRFQTRSMFIQGFEQVNVRNVVHHIFTTRISNVFLGLGFTREIVQSRSLVHNKFSSGNKTHNPRRVNVSQYYSGTRSPRNMLRTQSRTV